MLQPETSRQETERFSASAHHEKMIELKLLLLTYKVFNYLEVPYVLNRLLLPVSCKAWAENIYFSI